MQPTTRREMSQQDSDDVAEVQRLLLPRELPELRGWTMAVQYTPCHSAGGDFYGFRPLPSGQLGVAVADVSGHGVRAAVIMAMLRAWLGAAQHFERPAVSVAEDLNTMLLELDGLTVFVTGVFFVLDPATGIARYINCGHPPARVRRANGSVETLTGGGTIPLGISAELRAEEAGVVELAPGDSLVLFTDGIVEASDAEGNQFDYDGLDRLLASTGGRADRTLSAILEAVTAHRGNQAQADDECVLVLSRNAG